MTSSSRGRPRDPDVDRRIKEAAVDTFGQQGWAGFSMDVVSRQAGVGKAAMYLRWKSREELLVDAMEDLCKFVEDVDTGSVRDDLVHLAGQLLDRYSKPSGPALIRLHLDSCAAPELMARYHAFTRSQILAARRIVHRAVGRAELPLDASATLLMDALCGGVLNHTLTTPPELVDEVAAKADEFVADLVDFVLIGARGSSDGRRPGRPARASSVSSAERPSSGGFRSS